MKQQLRVRKYKFVCITCGVEGKCCMLTRKYCDSKCKGIYKYNIRKKAFKSLTEEEKANVLEQCRKYYFDLGRDEIGERRR